MITIHAVLLEEAERFTLSRVAPLVPLAYPTSDLPDRERPAGRAVVDPRDPRLRVLIRLGEHRDPVTFPVARMALDVLTAIDAVVREQADPGFWTGLVTDRALTPEDRLVSRVMAAERVGQRPRVEEALTVVMELVARLTRRDDPEFWAQVEDDLIDPEIEPATEPGWEHPPVQCPQM